MTIPLPANLNLQGAEGAGGVVEEHAVAVGMEMEREGQQEALNVGLVQPIANWAKRDEPNRGGRPVCLGGWWIMVFPVAGTVRGHSSPTHGPSNLTTRVPLSASPYHIITTLLTARVRYFSRSLFLAFVISRVLYCPPTHPGKSELRPHCHIGKHRW